MSSIIADQLKRFTDAPWKVLSIFSVLGLLGILNHAMWRDEMNTWLIVRDSQSFMDMVSNVNYQGHPLLWALSLSVIRNLSINPISMQIFHLILGIIALVVFWYYSPFTHKHKLLFTFGYLPFYQYLLIARNYSLGMLWLFGFCALFISRRKTYLFLATLLGLMANSNAYALFLSLSLFCTLIVEFIFDKNHRRKYFQKSHKLDLLLSALVLFALYALAIYIIAPPADSYNHGGTEGWFLTLDLRHLLRSIGRIFGGYFLIIPNSKKWLDLVICDSIIVLALAVFAFSLIKKPVALFFYIVGNLQLLAFTYFRFIGAGPRHFGHFYLILVAALWLAKISPESDYFLRKADKVNILNISPKAVAKYSNIIFTVILCIHFLTGITYGYIRDLIIPYSASKETALYIQVNNLEDQFIVASQDAKMAALSGYLERKFYYPELKQMGSFTLFKEPRTIVEHDEILRQIQDLLISQNIPEILLILNQELEAEQNDLKIDKINSFERAWIDTERYHLYWVELQ
ncbi:hypothetical protein FEK30_15055 [Picosynechococcus sp. PCC 11901]|uniref:hypothetical protein n=1 Tax=Picosynechococcus sp. PCC 11901 TaxID=2579791 RepID=UPI0010FBDE1C|nr:hypothetical protein [Picosynechococcus sp. PCC 11901]QCS50637.1 hypothetical protein FEK30_15055 [Picosynechococcus sp. PCC 11901]